MNAGLVDLFGDDSCDSSDEELAANIPEVSGMMPPEQERGNKEYKLKLVEPTPLRLEHLITQMKWRLQEGLGEAVYEIGVQDNGVLYGLNDEDMRKSMNTLQMMSERLGARLTVLRECAVISETPAATRKWAEVLVRKVPDDHSFVDVRIAVLGNVESGKSTLVSVLTHNELDNGQGRARLNLLRHIHEIRSGRTSSINNGIMGFDDQAEVQNFGNCSSTDEICLRSSKIVTFIDLAGHSKYMKTTVFGLTGYAPDFTMLVVNANNGIAGTTIEHLSFSLALNVHVFIVINKADLCSTADMNKTLESVESMLRSAGCAKTPMLVNCENDAILAAQRMSDDISTCPIFQISCVDGSNIDKLRKFLNLLTPRNSLTPTKRLANDNNVNEPEEKLETDDLDLLPEFHVGEVYFKKKTGNILAGMLIKGCVQENEKLLLGPLDSGEFMHVQVETLQCMRVPRRIVRAGQSAALSIGTLTSSVDPNQPIKLRKGMVLLHEKMNPKGCMEFQADIVLLFHSNQISKGFQATVHCNNVCQTAYIVWMDKYSIKSNEKASVVWRFKSRPEYLTTGSRLLFREGLTKGLGEVTGVLPMKSVPAYNDENLKNDTSSSTNRPPPSRPMSVSRKSQLRRCGQRKKNKLVSRHHLTDRNPNKLVTELPTTSATSTTNDMMTAEDSVQ